MFHPKINFRCFRHIALRFMAMTYLESLTEEIDTYICTIDPVRVRVVWKALVLVRRNLTEGYGKKNYFSLRLSKTKLVKTVFEDVDNTSAFSLTSAMRRLIEIVSTTGQKKMRDVSIFHQLVAKPITTDELLSSVTTKSSTSQPIEAYCWIDKMK